MNLFSDVPAHLAEEVQQILAQNNSVRIERIISHGHASPPDFWYDQDQHEWVLLVQGAARLLLTDPEELLEMQPGDFVNIPSHRKHRVEWTTTEEPTIWLAVFYN